MENQKVPRGPYRLVTVNTAPERAQRLVGRLVDELKDRYTIYHAANCESSFNVLFHVLLISDTRSAIDAVEQTVRHVQPDLLVSLKFRSSKCN